MTKSRTPFALFALTIGAAVALGGVTPAEAYYNRIAFKYASTPAAAIDELPAPPKLATAPKEPGRRQSETWLIGEEVLPPAAPRRGKGEKITIHGQYDMPSARKPRIAGPQKSPTLR